jgi:ribosome-binding factor A
MILRLTGMPSITRVKLSADLSIADVYVHDHGHPRPPDRRAERAEALGRLMRTKLTKVLTLRQAPFLKFHIDEGLKKEIRGARLIRKANEEDRQRTGGEQGARGH